MNSSSPIPASSLFVGFPEATVQELLEQVAAARRLVPAVAAPLTPRD